jgi:hypothetical protein
MKMEYKDKLPNNCPPKDAQEPNNFTIFRMVKTIPPTDIDFVSHFKLFPDKNYENMKCEALSVSVFNRFESCKELLDIPNHRGKKIVKLNLFQDSGRVIKSSKDKSHYSWWIYANFSPLANYEEIT